MQSEPIDVFLLFHILTSFTSSLSPNIILHGLLPTGSIPPPVSSFIGGLGLGTRIVSTSTSSLLRLIQELLSDSKLISPIYHRSQTTAQQRGMSSSLSWFTFTEEATQEVIIRAGWLKRIFLGKDVMLTHVYLFCVVFDTSNQPNYTENASAMHWKKTSDDRPINLNF